MNDSETFTIDCMPKEFFQRFADLTRDTNPAHTDVSVARRLGLRDTPLQGVALQEYFNRAAAFFTPGLSPTTYLTKFSKSVFPGDRLLFKRVSSGGDGLSIRCVNQDGEVAIANFSSGGEEVFSGQNLGGAVYEISPENAEEFYALTGQEPKRVVPVGLVFSLLPATLLHGAGASNGELEVLYRQGKFSLLRNLDYGEFEVGVGLLREPAETSKRFPFIYEFCGDGFQRERHVFSGKIKIMSKKRLDLSSFRS